MATDPTDNPAVPRVLLFGHPGSGKSSLLGALIQAADTQPAAFGAEILDPPRTLELLRDHIYHDTDFTNTGTELVRYLLALRPNPTNADPGAVPPAVELLDCDGTAANALLRHPDPLTERRVRGTVAAAVVAADLIALVVNAADDDAKLNRSFDDFVMFLERVQGRKAFGREVGGFPVYVVLTHCDLLARRGDTPAAWEERVRETEQRVVTRFSEFLDEHAADPDPTDSGPAADDSPYLPFGGLEVEGYAVAVRRPELLADPDPANEPFGVAEFFRDAVIAAAVHRRRVRSSGRRLRVMVGAVLLAVVGLAGGAAGVAAFQPPPADPGLTDRVRGYELRESPAAVRLAEKNIARNKRALAAFRADPWFPALPEDLQEFVDGRLREIDAYEAYRTKLLATPAPADARTLDDLDRSAAVLSDDLALPPEYTWADTEAALLRDKWLADVGLIRDAESAWFDWYRGLVNRGTTLTVTAGFDGDWRSRVGELVDAADRPPFDQSATLPGSEAVPQPRGEAATYRVPFEFDRVYQARHDWDFTRTRLLHLRDLADALALTPDPAGDPGRRALAVSPPGSGDTASLPADRLAALARHYPRPSALYPRPESAGPDLGGAGTVAYPEWALANFPEPGRAVLAARVRESAENGGRHVRELLGRLHPLPAADTPEGWAQAADTLGGPPFRAWGAFLHVLARLENPRAADPVADLAAFLRARQFDFDVKGFELAIPLSLRVPVVVPTGPVTVTITPRGGGAAVTRTFAPDGDGVQQGLVTVHRFASDAGFAYRPGDGFRAEVPARSGDGRFRLVWDDGGSQTFQFDRLTREPKIVRDGVAAEPAPGVTLTPAAGSRVPAVPPLLPR